MSDALYIAATGMQAQQLNVDTIANNLANVNTPGFKAGRVNFTDLVQQGISASNLDGAAKANQSRGGGVGVSNLTKLFSPGDIKRTEAPLDLAIQGAGMIEVVLSDGSAGYIRGGTLRVDQDGMLTDADGNALKPSIHVGSDVREIILSPNGKVMARAAGEKTLREAGRIELAAFNDPSGLEALGANVFKTTERSGEPRVGMPGEDGFGKIVQGGLEGSNVKLVDEMVNLMAAQRAYEMNVKVIQAADEMRSMSNNLRK